MTKMNLVNSLKATLSALTLMFIGGLVACSGGGTNNPPPPPAKTIADRLDYTNPTSGTFTLVKNASSTPTHLVLDLMGPAGTQASGVGFYLSADTGKVTWTKVNSSDAEFIKNGVFNLGSGTQLIKAKVAGNDLQAGVYQKGTTAAPVTLTASSVLASVALDLKSNVPLGAVTFSAPSGKALLTNGSATPVAITITPGTLQAN